MSAAIPLLQPCCLPDCDDPPIVNIPGPAGNDGEDGTDGADGISAFTALTVAYTMPAEGASSNASVGATAWMVVGENVFAQTLGTLEVTNIVNATTVTLKNIENAATSAYLPNAAPGTVAPIGSKIGPSGLQGPDGVIAGTAAGGDLKGTYANPLIARGNSKGMLIVGNGTDAKDLAVGTDGQMVSADATQALGVKWSKPLPITADTDVADNRIPRLNGTTGLPIPLQASKVEINDQGNIVAVGSGGNSRGTDATDLQTSRTAATQVASGARSVITGGQKNTAAGTEGFVGGGNNNAVGAGSHGAIAGGNQNSTGALDDAFVGGGLANASTGNASAICGGNGNTASAASSFVGAGGANTASGSGASVVGGVLNTASGPYSHIPGGFYALATKHGQSAHASGRFAVDGDAQVSDMILRNTTGNATPTELFLDGAALRMVVPADTSWFFQISIVARGVGPIDGCYRSEGMIRNNAGVTSVDGVVTTIVYDNAGFPATPVAVDMDVPNNSLRIMVTGIAATSIRWVAHVRLVECHL